jgi:CheY-like chemotaxis protein
VSDVVRGTLERHGYSVSTAASWVEGLNLAKGARYDLVITDVLLPEMGDLQIIQTLREHEGYANLPIVLISDSTTSVRTRPKRDRWTRYVAKPVSQEALWNTVNELLVSKAES